MHPDPLHQAHCPTGDRPPASHTQPTPPGSTSPRPKTTGFPSEAEIFDSISKLRASVSMFANLLDSFSYALAALTKQPSPVRMNAEELYRMLKKRYEPTTQSPMDALSRLDASLSAPASTSQPSRTAFSSTVNPAPAASSPFRVPPSFMPTAGASLSTGAASPARLTDSRLALEYFRLEATMDDAPPVIGSGDFCSLMTKLVGLVKIGYSFKFYPQRCRVTEPAQARGLDGVILRKNDTGTYRVHLDGGLVVENVKPWEVVEIA